MLAGPPQTPVVIPSAVEDLINGRPFEVVWLNGLGGLTFRIRKTYSSVYVKWLPVTSEVDVTGEMERLRWASAYTPVPTLVDYGSDCEGSWIVTEAIDAENAVATRWKRDPKSATAALAPIVHENSVERSMRIFANSLSRSPSIEPLFEFRAGSCRDFGNGFRPVGRVQPRGGDSGQR